MKCLLVHNSDNFTVKVDKWWECVKEKRMSRNKTCAFNKTYVHGGRHLRVTFLLYNFLCYNGHNVGFILYIPKKLSAERTRLACFTKYEHLQ